MAGFKKLTAGDGHDFDCWIEPATGPRRGGLVIIQEIFGVTDQLKQVAASHARDGYEVAIPALFDRQAPDQVIPFTEAERGRDLMLASDLERTMMDIGAAIDMLAGNGGRVGVIGYCWGGGLAIRTAQIHGVAAAVAYYATRIANYQIDPIRAPVLAHWGTEDKHATPEVIAAAQAFFPEMEVHLYEGADHAFANEARPNVHNPQASATAAERTRAFLAKHVG